MASTALLTHPLAAVLQSISAAAQRIANLLECGGPRASQWTPTLVAVPGAVPGASGVQLLADNPNRLGAMIVNTDSTNTVWLGPSPRVGYPGGGSSSGTPLFPQQSIAWNTQDADRGLARYAVAVGGAVTVSVTEVL